MELNARINNILQSKLAGTIFNESIVPVQKIITSKKVTELPAISEVQLKKWEAIDNKKINDLAELLKEIDEAIPIKNALNYGKIDGITPQFNIQLKGIPIQSAVKIATAVNNAEKFEIEKKVALEKFALMLKGDKGEKDLAGAAANLMLNDAPDDTQKTAIKKLVDLKKVELEKKEPQKIVELDIDYVKANFDPHALSEFYEKLMYQCFTEKLTGLQRGIILNQMEKNLSEFAEKIEKLKKISERIGAGEIIDAPDDLEELATLSPKLYAFNLQKMEEPVIDTEVLANNLASLVSKTPFKMQMMKKFSTVLEIDTPVFGAYGVIPELADFAANLANGREILEKIATLDEKNKEQVEFMKKLAYIKGLDKEEILSNLLQELKTNGFDNAKKMADSISFTELEEKFLVRSGLMPSVAARFNEDALQTLRDNLIMVPEAPEWSGVYDILEKLKMQKKNDAESEVDFAKRVGPWIRLFGYGDKKTIVEIKEKLDKPKIIDVCKKAIELTDAFWGDLKVGKKYEKYSSIILSKILELINEINEDELDNFVGGIDKIKGAWENNLIQPIWDVMGANVEFEFGTKVKFNFEPKAETYPLLKMELIQFIEKIANEEEVPITNLVKTMGKKVGKNITLAQAAEWLEYLWNNLDTEELQSVDRRTAIVLNESLGKPLEMVNERLQQRAEALEELETNYRDVYNRIYQIIEDKAELLDADVEDIQGNVNIIASDLNKKIKKLTKKPVVLEENMSIIQALSALVQGKLLVPGERVGEVIRGIGLKGLMARDFVVSMLADIQLVSSNITEERKNINNIINRGVDAIRQRELEALIEEKNKVLERVENGFAYPHIIEIIDEKKVESIDGEKVSVTGWVNVREIGDRKPEFIPDADDRELLMNTYFDDLNDGQKKEIKNEIEELLNKNNEISALTTNDDNKIKEMKVIFDKIIEILKKNPAPKKGKPPKKSGGKKSTKKRPPKEDEDEKLHEITTKINSANTKISGLEKYNSFAIKKEQIDMMNDEGKEKVNKLLEKLVEKIDNKEMADYVDLFKEFMNIFFEEAIKNINNVPTLKTPFDKWMTIVQLSKDVYCDDKDLLPPNIREVTEMPVMNVITTALDIKIDPKEDITRMTARFVPLKNSLNMIFAITQNPKLVNFSTDILNGALKKSGIKDFEETNDDGELKGDKAINRILTEVMGTGVLPDALTSIDETTRKNNKIDDSSLKVLFSKILKNVKKAFVENIATVGIVPKTIDEIKQELEDNEIDVDIDNKAFDEVETLIEGKINAWKNMNEIIEEKLGLTAEKPKKDAPDTHWLTNNYPNLSEAMSVEVGKNKTLAKWVFNELGDSDKLGIKKPADVFEKLNNPKNAKNWMNALESLAFAAMIAAKEPGANLENVMFPLQYITRYFLSGESFANTLKNPQIKTYLRNTPDGWKEMSKKMSKINPDFTGLDLELWKMAGEQREQINLKLEDIDRDIENSNDIKTNLDALNGIAKEILKNAFTKKIENDLKGTMHEMAIPTIIGGGIGIPYEDSPLKKVIDYISTLKTNERNVIINAINETAPDNLMSVFMNLGQNFEAITKKGAKLVEKNINNLPKMVESFEDMSFLEILELLTDKNLEEMVWLNQKHPEIAQVLRREKLIGLGHEFKDFDKFKEQYEKMDKKEIKKWMEVMENLVKLIMYLHVNSVKGIDKTQCMKAFSDVLDAFLNNEKMPEEAEKISKIKIK